MKPTSKSNNSISSPWKGEDKGGGQQFREVAPKTLKNARQLRKEPSEAEKKLWQLISRHQIEGCHFRRQHPVGSYIADFACTKKKLIIEVDGGQHASQQSYDNARTHYLEKNGYRVLRFWNNEVLNNIEGVHQKIVEALHAIKTPTQPSPFQGEE